MIMIVVGVDVGGDDGFVLAAPEFAGQFDANLMCMLRSDFPGREALISMEDQVAAYFSKALFGHFHLVISHARDAVQACDQLSIHSFFFVHDIRNCVIHVTFDGPDLCCCHMQRLLSNKKSEISLAYQ